MTGDGRFEGFPRGVHQTPTPSPLLGPLLAEIDDIGELKCTLRAVALLHLTDRRPRWISENELLSDDVLLGSLGARDAVAQALELAVGRRTLLRMGTANRQLILNTHEGRLAVQRMVYDSGPETGPAPAGTTITPNIFALYEDNIGALSPMIADELKRAEADYPADWITDAFKESAVANARSWRYVRAVLERWQTEGRGDGRPESRSADGRTRGHIKEAGTKPGSGFSRY
jgi:DnaD/phage-associated family protein